MDGKVLFGNELNPRLRKCNIDLDCKTVLRQNIFKSRVTKLDKRQWAISLIISSIVNMWEILSLTNRWDAIWVHVYEFD